MFAMDVTLTAKVRSRPENVIEELTAMLRRRGIESVAAPDGSVTFRGVEGNLTLRPTADGAILELRGLDMVDEDNEAGWVAQFVLAPLVESLDQEAIADWITDRWARRPSGAAARAGYRDPTHHRPSFGAVLSALRLSAEDVLLEIGCGGGAFLE